MPAHAITLVDTGETFACTDRRSVLDGMAALGKRGIPVGCRGGGCGVCKVQVLRGEVLRRPMSRAHVSEADEAAGTALACRILPASDLVLSVLGPMRRAVLRAAAPVDPSLTPGPSSSAPG